MKPEKNHIHLGKDKKGDLIMKGIKLMLALFLVSNLLMAMSANEVLCGKNETERVKACVRVLSEIMSGSQGKAPVYLLSHSNGIVILPGIKKAAFIIGAKRGKGVIVIRKNGKWLPPSFITISGGSLGFQAGAKSSDVVLIIMTKEGVKRFKSNELRLGVDIGITAGPVGKETGISSEDLYKVDMYSYVKEKGIFAGVNLSGSIITHDNDSNLRFYEKEITLVDILDGKLKSKDVPEIAKKLISTLDRYCKNK